MKKTILTFVFFYPLLLLAQRPAYQTDSLNYYMQRVVDMRRAVFDSLSNSADYQGYLRRIGELRKKSNNYNGTVLLFDLFHSNFSGLNKAITQHGFPRMTELSLRVGFGVTAKKGRAMYDIYFYTGGLRHESQKGDERVLFSASNALEMNWGIDLLHSRGFSIYPYGGFSLRFSTLRFTKPAVLNPSFTDITNIISNESSVRSTTTRLGYQAGLGFDCQVNKQKDQGATFLFAKFGVNRPFGRERFRISGVTYDPGIKSGDWLLSVGVKFTMRDE